MIEQIGNTANECVESALDDLARSLECLLSKDVITFSGPLLYTADDIVRSVVETRRDRRPGLAVILETNGGYMEPVRRIVEVLRHHYGEVEFIIPNHAMSAGTVLVMSGDAIHMDYYSNLGPIDPQVQTRDGRLVPALGYLAQYNRLLALATAGNVSAAELAILLQFDQAELYSFEHERELSISFLQEWLAKYKFKNWRVTETTKTEVTPEMRIERARDVATGLNDTEKWHSHGTGVSMEVLRRDLKLVIEDFGGVPELSKQIRSYHRLMASYQETRGVEILVHQPGITICYGGG